MTSILRSTSGVVAARLGAFDASALQREASTVDPISEAVQSGPYHDGSWRGVALVAPGGDWRTADPNGSRTDARPTATSLMERMPAFRRLVNFVGAPVVAARIMSLPPGAAIGTHRDTGIGLERGLARLATPIVEPRETEVWVDGIRLNWREGEMWWVDYGRPHRVSNGSRRRLTLICDAIVTRQLLDLFPNDALHARAAYVPPPALPASEGKAMCGLVNIPEEACEWILAPPGPAIVEMRDGELVLATASGVIRLERVGETSARLQGSAPTVTLDWCDDSRRYVLTVRHFCTAQRHPATVRVPL